MKYKDSHVPISKKDLNRLKMNIYRSHGMSVEQREKVKDYDRKKTAARQLKPKMEREVKREITTSGKHKSRENFKIPTSPAKYAKLVSNVVKVAE